MGSNADNGIGHLSGSNVESLPTRRFVSTVQQEVIRPLLHAAEQESLRIARIERRLVKDRSIWHVLVANVQLQHGRSSAIDGDFHVAPGRQVDAEIEGLAVVDPARRSFT